MINNKKGISLIVLVITIIVIIILAGAVILSLSANNPISQASKATYLTDIKNFQTELELYKVKNFSTTLGAYNTLLLDANATSLKYNNVLVGTDTINTIIPTLGLKAEYAGQFEIIDGNLFYIGADQNKKDWALEINLGTDTTVPTIPVPTVSPSAWTNGNVTVTVVYPADAVSKEYSTNGTTWLAYPVGGIIVSANGTVYARGKDLAGNIGTSSTTTVANIDKTAPAVTASIGGATSSSITITAVASDTGGSALNTSSYCYSKDNGVTWTTATNATTYTYSAVPTGTYQCKVKVADTATNTTISSAVAITTSSIGAITLVKSPTTWTNGNVVVTITYPAVVTTKLYSIDGVTWLPYTAAVTVSTNNITVSAKGTDVAGNQATLATSLVSNIDKIAPVVTASNNGGATTTSIVVKATATDTGGSALNAASYCYSKDNGVTWTAATSATTYTYTGLTTKIAYQCKVKVADTAGNSTISAAVAISTL